MRPGTHQPAVGQTWSLTNGQVGRYEITIQRIEPHPESGMLRAYGVSAAGHAMEVDVRTLRRGLRAAHLVKHADGTPAERRAEFRRDATCKPDTDRKPTVREYRPRGVVKRTELTEEERRILEMRAKDMSRAAIARELGLKTAEQVATREQNARDILAMQKLRAAS